MNKTSLLELVHTLGITKISESNGNISIPCPFAPIHHASGKDDNPSMSISFSDSDRSLVQCFTCHTDGVLVSVLAELEKKIKGSVPEGLVEQVRLAEAENLPGMWLRAGRKHVASLEATQPGVSDDSVWPEEFLANFRRAIHPYLIKDRGIDEATCRLFSALYDEFQRRVVFPVRRQKDKALVGVLGRYLGDWEADCVPKYRDYSGFNKGRFFFGEHLLDLDKPRIILVEGPMDVLKLWSLGFRNVLGMMGTSVTQVRVEKLAFWDKPVYISTDRDKAGNDARLLLSHALGRRLKLFDVPHIPGRKDPGDCVSADEFQSVLSKSTYIRPKKA